MANKNLFDDISRMLASPMPRRQALKLAAGTLIGTALTTLFPGYAAALAKAQSTRLRDFEATGKTVPEILQHLRDNHNFPVSFIDAEDATNLDIHVANGTTRDVLVQMLQKNPNYRITEINGRTVVFPNNPLFDTPVNGMNIRGIPRLAAAQLYIDELKKQVPGFQNLAGVLMKGDPTHPLFRDPVALSANAPVLQHLVELLGNDPNAAFSILRSAGGAHVMLLHAVQPPPAQGFMALAAAAAATCRALSITYANQMNVACPGGSCGAQIQFDITGVSVCPGDDCSGMNVTEAVTTDNACGPGTVTTGAGCAIGAGNTIPPGCTDIYGLCGPPGSFPAGGCTETYTQTITVNGRTVQTCSIVFKITFDKAGACSGTVTRSCTSSSTADQCCKDAGGKGILCPSGQVCVGGNTCCAKGVNTACNGTCCPKGAAGDYVCVNNACCPKAQTCNSNKLCCKANETCINNACCPNAQACNTNTVCCPSGQTCVGGKNCCPTGVTTVCNGTCCPAGNYVCVNNACCAAAQSCNGTCCQSTETCVNGMCCSDDQEC